MDISSLEDAYLHFKAELLAYLTQSVSPIHYYHVGSVVLVFSFFFADKTDTFLIFLALGTNLLSIGFCWEVFVKLKVLLKDNIASLIILGIPSGVIVSTLSLTIAQHLVNEVTHLNPDYFDNSVRILASLSTPFVIAYLFALGLTLYYVINIISIILKAHLSIFKLHIKHRTTQDSMREDFLTLARGAAAIFLSLQVFWVLVFVPESMAREIKNVTKYAVTLLDYYSYGPCTNVQATERFAFLEGDNISVVSLQSDLLFETKKCITK
ncbi:MAG: hypothetical protein JAY90_18125 [Candidatus Thiodiazotropha lotti]|nr:hypothetical protein [Candidatus Thiodiazotropha lotti]